MALGALKKWMAARRAARRPDFHDPSYIPAATQALIRSAGFSIDPLASGGPFNDTVLTLKKDRLLLRFVRDVRDRDAVFCEVSDDAFGKRLNRWIEYPFALSAMGFSRRALPGDIYLCANDVLDPKNSAPLEKLLDITRGDQFLDLLKKASALQRGGEWRRM